MTQSKIKGDTIAEASEQGMIIERRFTQVDKDPFDQFEWTTSDFIINNPDGSIAFEIPFKLPCRLHFESPCKITV